MNALKEAARRIRLEKTAALSESKIERAYIKRYGGRDRWDRQVFDPETDGYVELKPSSKKPTMKSKLRSWSLLTEYDPMATSPTKQRVLATRAPQMVQDSMVPAGGHNAVMERQLAISRRNALDSALGKADLAKRHGRQTAVRVGAGAAAAGAGLALLAKKLLRRGR